MTFEAVTRGIQQTSPLVLQGRNMAMEEIARKQSLQRYDQQQFLQALMNMAGFMRQREKDEAAAGQQTIENERADKQLKMQQNESAAKVAQMAVQNKWTETQIGRVADSMGLEQDMLRAQIAAISGGEERAVEQLQMQQNESAARIAQMAVEGGWKKAQINEMEGMLGLRQGMLQAQIDALRGGERRADEGMGMQQEAHDLQMRRGGTAADMEQAQYDEYMKTDEFRRGMEEWQMRGAGAGVEQQESNLRVSQETERDRIQGARNQAEMAGYQGDIARMQANEMQRDAQFQREYQSISDPLEQKAFIISNKPQIAAEFFKLDQQLGAVMAQAQAELGAAATPEMKLDAVHKLFNEREQEAKQRFRELQAEDQAMNFRPESSEYAEFTELKGLIGALDKMRPNLAKLTAADLAGKGAETIYFNALHAAYGDDGGGATTGTGIGPDGKPVRMEGESAADFRVRQNAAGY